MDTENKTDDTDELLRYSQINELRGLKECFADQLVDLRKFTKNKGSKKKRKGPKWLPLELSVKIETKPESIAQFDLHIKCNRKYPLVPPCIGFKNVRGIGRALITKLHKQLKQEAASEEHRGEGCIALLIMRAQQFLEDHYRDLELNNKSFYDQMVEQKQSCDRKAELNRKHQDEMDKLERERQVEEIRQKILKKRELYNESRKRRDSSNSTLDNEPEDSTYDYDGDLDGDSTAASTTDDLDTNRLEELSEIAEDGETLVRSRRSTFVGSRELSMRSELNLERNIGRSRVDLEYEVIEELGHGGFGTVYKVRNRVDSRLYALKKVKLNPDNETLNEKIMREVKLLSRLNHENVIRYYTAWNETEAQQYNSKSTPSNRGDSAISSNLNQESCILSQKDLSQSSDDETDDVYHTSYLINNKNVEKIDSGDITANYVVFEASDSKDETEIVESMKKALGPTLSDDESSDGDTMNSLSTGRVKINRWLYIQMELGQGTLREAIDRGLPNHKDRARRFFREILDGLCHIHRQGIIHRDLKPVNIFLDSMDRPKIGDFGLATTNLFIVTQSLGPGKQTATAIKPNRMSLEKVRLLASPDQGDSPNEAFNKSGERLKYIQNNQTDNIGTPLYMSPELSATSETTRIAKVVYTHKVDVYSLGIIYFEMLYPFKTGHERINTLQDLRNEAIVMPSDVDTHLTREETELIKMLLTHDVAARPTSEKLLASNLLPSVGIKEREYQNIIKQVVQNRQARTHKHMIRLLFDQNDSFVDDFVFDFEDIDHTGSAPNKSDIQNILKDFNTNVYILDQVKAKLEHLLRSRGYVNFVTPTLMPKYSASKYYGRQQLEDVVMLMDKNSSIVTLPYDLRLPFARQIARTNINYMSRFAMEKIFRQRQILGYHPDQLWECCVDFVTPLEAGSLQSNLADSEILSLMSDVVRVLPALQSLAPTIKLNHIGLVREIMLFLGIDEASVDELLLCIKESISVSSKHGAQYVIGQPSSGIPSPVQQSTGSLPNHVKEELKKDLLASRLLTNNNITLINGLISFLDLAENSPLELLESIEQTYKARGMKAGLVHLDQIRGILQGLDEIISYAHGLGLDLPVRISPGFVLSALRPIEFYSGMVTLLECRRHSKVKSQSKARQSKRVIIAVGGRYDKLLEKFSRNRSEVFDRIHSGETANVNRETRPKAAVGVSFEVEKLSRFVFEDYADRVNSQDPSTIPSLSQLVQLNQNSHQLPSTSLTLVGQQNASLTIRYWPLDIAICSLTYPKCKSYVLTVSSMIRQLREKGLICGEIVPEEFPSFSLNSLTLHCSENRIPYLITIKTQPTDVISQQNHSPGTSPSSPSSSKSASSSFSNSHMVMSSCIATLYQLDRNRLREMKRCDISSMVEYLIKR